MGKAAYDAKLAAIEALGSAEPDAREAGLKKALRERNNFLVAKAAKVAALGDLRALIPDLLAAFDRFMHDAEKSDPQCWAKSAIAKSLVELQHADPDVYVRGLRHIQLEPVWGGQADSAAGLRAECAMALVGCRGLSDLQVLELLVEPLFDADKTVRSAAASALGRFDRREAGLLLRVRALAGDSEPEPMGAIYAALLAVEGKPGIRFMARFLEAQDPAEAAFALGETHDPDALELLKGKLARTADRVTRGMLYAAIALTRLPDAIEFLLDRAEDGSREAAQALEGIPLPAEQRARLEKVRG